MKEKCIILLLLLVQDFFLNIYFLFTCQVYTHSSYFDANIHRLRQRRMNTVTAPVGEYNIGLGPEVIHLLTISQQTLYRVGVRRMISRWTGRSLSATAAPRPVKDIRAVSWRRFYGFKNVQCLRDGPHFKARISIRQRIHYH